LAGCYLFAIFSPFWTSAAEFSLALALICWVADWFFEFPRPFPADYLILPVAFFFLALFSSAWAGLSFPRSMVFISKQWVFLALFFFALRLKDANFRQKIFTVLGISAGLVALYAVLQHFTGWHWLLPHTLEPLGHRFRSTGFFPGLLVSSLYFVLTGMVFLNLGWPQRKTAIGKIFLTAAGLCCLAVLFNAGRAGILAFGTGLLFFLVLNFSRQKLYALGGALGLTLAAYLASPAIFSRFEQFKGYEFEQSAENRRLAVWHRSYEIFQDHSVFGIGPDNFKTAYSEKIKGSRAIPLGHAHNDFLNVLVYAGLFGLTAFLFFWKQLTLRLWRGFKENRTSPYLLAGVCVLAAYLVYAQFESSLVYREIRMVLFFLLGAALSVLEEKTA